MMIKNSFIGEQIKSGLAINYHSYKDIEPFISDILFR